MELLLLQRECTPPKLGAHVAELQGLKVRDRMDPEDGGTDFLHKRSLAGSSALSRNSKVSHRDRAAEVGEYSADSVIGDR